MRTIFDTQMVVCLLLGEYYFFTLSELILFNLFDNQIFPLFKTSIKLPVSLNNHSLRFHLPPGWGPSLSPIQKKEYIRPAGV